MYYIDSTKDKPNIDKLFDRVNRLMADGIRTKNLDSLLEELRLEKVKLAKEIRDLYGIDNPNSHNQILTYFDREINKEILSLIDLKYTGLSVTDIKRFMCMCYDNKYRSIDDLILRLGDKSDSFMQIKDILGKLLDTSIAQYIYKEGKWTTNKNVMAQLSLLGRADAVNLMQYRKLKNHTETIEKLIETSDNKGYIHPDVSLSKTNRIQYSSPALLNIPKEILWNVIRPKKEGNILISVDIKNQEPSIMINMLGIEELQCLLANSDTLYESVYYDIFNSYPDTVERKELKVAWLSLTYGASLKSIEESCTHIDGERVYKYFNSFKPYKQYKKKCNTLAKQNVQTTYTYFNTKLYANEIGSRLKRVLMDLPIQGTGSDILALLVEHFDREVYSRGLTDLIKIYYTRHDELIIEVDKCFYTSVGEEEVIELLRGIFEHQVDNWTPFKVEIETVNN